MIARAFDLGRQSLQHPSCFSCPGPWTPFPKANPFPEAALLLLFLLYYPPVQKDQGSESGVYGGTGGKASGSGF